MVVDGFFTDAGFTNAFDFNNPLDTDTTIYAKISEAKTEPEPVIPENNNAEKDETPKTGIENYLGIASLVMLFSTTVIILMKKKDRRG